MLRVKLEPTIIRYSTQISTCEEGQWQLALVLPCEAPWAKLELINLRRNGLTAYLTTHCAHVWAFRPAYPAEDWK